MTAESHKPLFQLVRAFLILSVVYSLRTSKFAVFIPPVLAGLAWWAAEKLKAASKNPLMGPWARQGTDREQALNVLWPLWRIAFALNVALLSWQAFTFNGSPWLIRATLTPWFVFSFFGVLSAVLHLAARDIATLESWIQNCRHVGYLIIGFVPYGVLCLTSLALLPMIWVVSLANRKTFRRSARRLGKHAFQLILVYLNWIGFIKVQFSDVNAMPAHGPGKLLVGNHISMFDIISILAHVDNCGTFVKRKYTFIPFIAPMIRACGFIPINPDDPESGKAALAAVKQSLLEGETFIVWPEGTRSRNGRLGEFHNGIFRLALEIGQDITPVLFSSSEPVFNNRGAMAGSRSTIQYSVEVGTPVRVEQPERVTPGKVLIMKSKIRQYFLTRLAEKATPAWRHHFGDSLEGAPQELLA